MQRLWKVVDQLNYRTEVRSLPNFFWSYFSFVNVIRLVERLMERQNWRITKIAFLVRFGLYLKRTEF